MTVDWYVLVCTPRPVLCGDPCKTWRVRLISAERSRVRDPISGSVIPYPVALKFKPLANATRRMWRFALSTSALCRQRML